jgi:hypothetical protein
MTLAFPSGNVSPFPSRIVSLRETLAAPYTPPPTLITGLLHQGEIGILIGRSGMGKTPLAVQLALCVAGGIPFFGRHTVARPAGVLALESLYDTREIIFGRMQHRLGISSNVPLDPFLLGNDDGDPNSRALREAIHLADDKARLGWLARLIRDRNYGLVIIDTMLTFMSLEATDEKGVRHLYAELRKLCATRPYPAIVFTGHLRKRDRKNPGPSLLDDPRMWLQEETLGTTAWTSCADVRLGFDRLGDDPDERDYKVLGGYRRGEDPLPPIITRPETETVEVDGVPTEMPILWTRADPSVLHKHAFTETEWDCFNKLPVGEVLSFKECVELCGAKSTWHRMQAVARANDLMTYEHGKYRRVA